MKHTKGPWRIGDAGQTIFGPKTEQPSPVIIATVNTETTARLPQDAVKANARLIAAAPELLEALEVVLKTLNAPDCPSIPDGAYTRGKIVEVIKKARGE